MIKYESELKATERKVRELERQIDHVVDDLRSANLAEAEIAVATGEQVRELDDLREQIHWFNEAKKGKTVARCNFRDIGRFLVALRLSKGFSQQDLAALLKVSPAQISKDELREYRGVSIERAMKILDALEAKIFLAVDSGPVDEPALKKTELPKVAQEISAAENVLDSAGELTKPVTKPVVEIPGDKNPSIRTEWISPKPPELREKPTSVVSEIKEAESTEIPEKKRIVLVLRVSLKNKTWGRDFELKRAVSDIEKQVLAGAKKLSGIDKFPEFFWEYEFVISVSEAAQSAFLESLAKQCEALAEKHKCSAKLELKTG